jgi:precorrin-2 dehydrogenase / sirohydrochlorin ferrochelatase
MAEPPSGLYPVMLRLAGRLAVVIGSGRAAEAKARSLSGYGADVVLVTPRPGPEVLALEADGLLTVERRDYVRGDLDGAFLVVCTSASPEVVAAVHAEAIERRVLFHSPQAPELCDYLVPASFERGPLHVAVSTEGRAPWLTKRVVRESRERFGAEWSAFAELVAAVRAYALEHEDATDAELAPLFDAVADSDVLDDIRQGAEFDAEQTYRRFEHVIVEGHTPGKDTA